VSNKKEFFRKLADLLQEYDAYIAGNANLDDSYLIIEGNQIDIATDYCEWLDVDTCRRLSQGE
jgi:hypothetical protein